MDIEKLFKEFVEKEWHDGHEPQGEHDHYEEEEVEEKIDMARAGYGGSRHKKIEKDKYNKKRKGQGIEDEVEKEARTYLDREDERKKKKNGKVPQSQKKSRWGSGGYGKGEEVEESEVEEGVKDLPPHLQKLVKKIEKRQKDWNKQNPDAQIKTLVYNPETGKPDIEVKENTMKLEDTVKQVLTKEPKLEEHCGVCDEQGIEEDSDKDEPGTQGDMAAYQKKRKAVAKKFGVSDCSQLDGAKKKACYKALDDAHVADHEEQVELKKMKKEETQKTFSKMFSHIKSLMQGK
jgi:hypothetical protein